MSLKVSNHAKRRVSERLNVSHKAKRNQLLNRALKYGHNYDEYKGDFLDYLTIKKNRKKSNIGIKVYDNNIYIYQGKIVITVFPVPKKYIPSDYYLRQNYHYLEELYKYVDKEKVLLEKVLENDNEVVTAINIDGYFENFGIGKNEQKSRENAVNIYLRKIKKEKLKNE